MTGNKISELVRIDGLIRERKIDFEGPAPPRQWPSLYKHVFQSIRDIDRIRYDEYQRDPNFEKRQRKYLKDRVRDLRETAYAKLDDINTPETEWRDLEPVIFEKFEKRAMW